MHKLLCILLLLCLLTAGAAQGESSPALPELTAQRGFFPANQRYEVYEILLGDVKVRAGSGKAVVSSNGAVWMYALWKGQLLVEYEIDDHRSRIGWIDAAPLPKSSLTGVPELSDGWDPAENVYGVVTSRTSLTDDPHASQTRIAELLPGTSVYVLARMADWYLVQAFAEGDKRMGFIPQDRVDLEHGYAANPEWEIGHATRYTEADIQSAFDALARCIYQQWPGTGLAAVRYDEIAADYADPNPWWTDETGQREGILLLADLSSMELHHYEIAGEYACDYLFYLHREPGGEWVVVNWGYT